MVVVMVYGKECVNNSLLLRLVDHSHMRVTGLICTDSKMNFWKEFLSLKPIHALKMEEGARSLGICVASESRKRQGN